MSERQHRRSNAVKNTSTVVQSSGMNEVIDLLELAYRLLARWKLIVCLALVFAIVSGIYTISFITPTYEATATIYVLNRSDSAINFSDLQIGTALTQDYIKVFKMWEVHEQVISNLNLPYTYNDMYNMLSIRNETNTRMLDITISSHDPEEAAAIANEYAKVASEYIEDTMLTDKPSIMSVALVPVYPASPSKTRNVMIGFLLGAFLACGYVTISFLMDDKYKTAEDIRKNTGLTTLAVVPIEQPGHKKGLGKKK